MSTETLEQKPQTSLSGNIPEKTPQTVDPSQSAEGKHTLTDDLLSRVTKFVVKSSPVGKSEDTIDKEVYNDAEFRAKIDSISDPELKDYMIKLRKSGISGITNKFQEIAAMRKEIQDIRDGLTPKGWTPERIQQLIKDPEFLQAAKQVAGTTSEATDEEYVPESVKRKLAELEEVKNQVSQWQQNQFVQNLEQEHSVLSQKYGNYDRNKVDEIRKELLDGKIRATSEHLYKAWYHDDNVRRAYEMGRQDAADGVGEKQRLSTFSGGSQTPNSDIKIEKNETDKQVWGKIVQKAIASIQKK